MSEREDGIGRGLPGRKEKEVPVDQASKLGSTVRTLRREKGWTAIELANRAGLHASYVSRLEHDRIRRRPSILHILSIADTLGVDIADLLGHDPFQPFQQPLESVQRMKGMIRREPVESFEELRAEIGYLTAEVRTLREAFVQSGIQIPKVEVGVEKAAPHRTTRLKPGTQRGQIL